MVHCCIRLQPFVKGNFLVQINPNFAYSKDKIIANAKRKQPPVGEGRVVLTSTQDLSLTSVCFSMISIPAVFASRYLQHGKGSGLATALKPRGSKRWPQSCFPCRKSRSPDMLGAITSPHTSGSCRFTLTQSECTMQRCRFCLADGQQLR